MTKKFVLGINYIIILISILFIVFGSNAQEKTDTSKMSFNLWEFTAGGLRKSPDGQFSSINYEFCISGNDESLNEVMSIDPTAQVYKNSKGRSACSDKEWLCIGSSRQIGFKNVILSLTKLSYIRKISETFWELL